MIVYLIKGIACSGVLWAFHYLFLEKERMHVFNRYYLLVAPVFSFFLPFIPFRGIFPAVLNERLEPAALIGGTIPDAWTVQAEREGAQGHVLMPAVLAGIYVVVAALVAVRFAGKLSAMMRIIKTYRQERINGAVIVAIPAFSEICSFLHYILCDAGRYEKNEIPEQVIAHELAHVRQKHTLDILFMELLSIVYWFNPVLALYKRSVRLNHEFLADRPVIEDTGNITRYQELLLDRLAVRTTALGSDFNYSQTKRRLIMMTQHVSRKRIALKGLALAVTAGLMFCMATDRITAQPLSPESPSMPPPPPPLDYSELPVMPPPPPPAEQWQYGEGLTQAELADYVSGFEKHKVRETTPKGLTYSRFTFSEAEKERLYALYRRMSREQQEQQVYVMMQMPVPVKNPPSEELFLSFKKAEVYGVWLDGKKVDNTALDGLRNTEIAEYFISKLYGKAREGRSYTHQLNLTTNRAFDAGYEERMKDRIRAGERTRKAK